MVGASTIQLRAPSDDDAEAIAELHAALTGELGIPTQPDPDEVRHEWAEPTFDRDRHARVVEIDGRIVATGAFWHQDTESWGFGGVLGGYRGRGIGSALLDWVVRTARAQPEARTLFTSSNIRHRDALALFESRGFAPVRTFFRMLHRTPGDVVAPAMPAGLRLETSLRGDALVDALIAGHDGSFIDHWNFVPWVRDDVEHMLTGPNIDPELLLVALSDTGEVAGINACFLEPAGGFTRGIVGVLGTTRPFRGIGLGSALLRVGVRALAERGAAEVELGVDAENMTGALGLYERAGFERNQERRVFSLDVS